MLAPEPFFVPRGTPISVYLRLQLLSRLGHQVTVLTYHLGQEVDLPGVRIHRIPNIRFISEVKVGPSWAKPLLDTLLFALAFKHLLSGTYQVIHTHEEAALIGMLLAALFRKAHIYDMHSSLPGQFKNFGFGNVWPLVQAFKLLEHWVLRTCHAVIVVGADLEQIVRRINPEARLVRLENLPVQAYGIHPSPEAVLAVRASMPPGKRVCIAYAGTFERYQGLDLLLNSAKLVALREPAALFMWVGGRPDQLPYWQAQVDANDLHDHILLCGVVPLAESLAYLEAADILVSPRRDGTSVPLKIYTYLQAGKPIVATQSFAHTQVLTSDTAMLVEPTPESLAAGILHLAGDPALRLALGRQAHALALEKFNVADHVGKLAELYRSLDVPAGRVPANQSAG
jgi:glycosyltransferase involved in cell wall biosynthesis